VVVTRSGRGEGGDFLPRRVGEGVRSGSESSMSSRVCQLSEVGLVGVNCKARIASGDLVLVAESEVFALGGLPRFFLGVSFVFVPVISVDVAGILFVATTFFGDVVLVERGRNAVLPDKGIGGINSEERIGGATAVRIKL
jgi:hypothetical protein